jgi:hypothetical protein
VKRKNNYQESAPHKSARIETDECPHLKVIDQNKETFKKVLERLSDYSGNEPVLCDSIRDLSLGLNGINEIMGVLLAERLFPGSSPDPVVIDTPSANLQGASGAQSSEFPFPPSQNQVNSRKPLNQAPLGDSGSWATAVRHGNKRNAQAGSKVIQTSQWLQDSESDSRPGKKQPTKDEIFVKAVKDAERSILVFNLDLGQQPTMNQSTISSKVTLSMVNTLDRKENRSTPSQEARDFVDDVLSQVVRMEFFGSKTAPCKSC